MSSTGYVHFTLLDARKAGYGFSTYNDRNGEMCFYSNRTDQYGNPLKRRFEFTYARRAIRIPSSQADVIKFLEEHPECEGSPNGYYKIGKDGVRQQIGVTFKKIDKGRDAEVAVDTMIDNLTAQNFVTSLDKDALRDAAVVLCNCYDPNPVMQTFELLNLAKNNSAAVLNYKNKEQNQELRSLVRRAVKLGVIVDDKVAYFLGNIRMGATEDAAIKYLLNNHDHYLSVKEKVDGNGFLDQKDNLSRVSDTAPDTEVETSEKSYYEEDDSSDEVPKVKKPTPKKKTATSK